MSLLFWLLGAVVVGYIGYTMYLATVLKWEDEQTVGLAYYGLPLAGRNAFKDTLRAHARRLRPLIQFNARFTKLDFAKSHITHAGVAGPGGSCSAESFAKAAAYTPRAEDVFVVTQMKCGTTWMQNVVYEVLKRGKGDLVETGGAMYAISPDRMRRFGNGHTLAYKVAPEQRPFSPQQVLSGVTRPHRATNLWISDASQPLPQWLELAWPEPQSFREVQLVFPGHLVREYHAYGPFYRDPQCPRDYAIDCWVSGNWARVLDVRDNYQRLRRARLPAQITTDRLRIIVTATNGDPSAAIYEIRCYA